VHQHRYPAWDDDGDVVTWPDTNTLVSDWWGVYLANGRFQKGTPRRETSTSEDAAAAYVDSLAGAGDARAVPVLLALAEGAPDREALFFFGAGPLEDLVHAHGDRVVTTLVEAARSSRRFKIALSGVWPDRQRPLRSETMRMLTPWLGDDETTPFD